MSDKPTKEQIEKLPKWAQEYIRDVNREREVAVAALNRWVDDQTPAPIYVNELECLGEQRGPSHKVRYVQGNRLRVDFADVALEVVLRDDVIDMQWSAPNYRTGDICFQPRSFQAAYLVAKKNMRD